MGAGKTTVLGEAAGILTLCHVAHAAINVDSLGLAHLPSAASSDSVMYDESSICLRKLFLSWSEAAFCWRVLWKTAPN